MYPHRELKSLASRKQKLRREISVRRVACAEAAGRAAKPLIWLERAVSWFQRAMPLLPIFGAPLALFGARKSAVKTSLVDSLMKWSPVVFQATRYASTAWRRPTAAGRAPTPSPVLRAVAPT